MTTARELIQRLVSELDCAASNLYPDNYAPDIELVLADANAYLAQPEPEGPTTPTRRQILMLADELGISGSVHLVQEAFRIWGHRAAIEPVPVSERPWEREGWCDAEGRCWWGRIEGNPANPEWFLAGLAEIEEFYEIGDWVVLLPHHALPIPQP